MAERALPPRVFVSSATGALALYRRAAVEVCHRLGLIPVHMEEFGPERPPPIEVCQRQVESCDLFVLLLAHRYGARPPGKQHSYTELEYEWAVSRPGMPVLAFVVDQTFAWPPPDIDRGEDAEALGRLVARVTSSHVVNRFAELAAFREDLILALKPYETASVYVDDRKKAERVLRRLPSPPAFHAAPPYVGSAPFVGRVDDLAMLDEWGRSPDPLMVVEAIGGTGKSALTWEWAQSRAASAIDGLAGRLWWSFYDGSASMARFLHELLAYVSGRPPAEVASLDRTELSTQVHAELRSRPYLLVLDGFERLLAAYHRFDPSKLHDDELEPARRSLIEPHAENVVRALAAASPSKILISTRLMPNALEGRFGRRIPGVRHLRLPGLTDADTAALLARLGVHGNDRTVRVFFHRLGNHPLLVGIVAGLVRDYRPDPGGFDRWLADPTAGGALSLPDLNLTQRRAHILDAALAGLSAGHRRLLGWISVLTGAVDWATVEAINPFRPEPPAPIEADLSSLGPEPFPLSRFEPPPPQGKRRGDRPFVLGETMDEQASSKAWLRARETWHAAADQLRAKAKRDTERRLAAWRSSEQVTRAKAQLDAALKDLEDRGLLWWDRSSNSYDLHPIVRAYVHDQLEHTDRVQANERIRDHFAALPSEDPRRATSVEDLRQTITIFRALVGAGKLAEAAKLWLGTLRLPFMLEIGAYSTVIELLHSFATRGSLVVRADWALAYFFLGRYDEAIDQETRLLAHAIQHEDVQLAQISLTWLGTAFAKSGAEVHRSRCLDLRSALASATRHVTNGSLHLARAELAVIQGNVGQALTLLDDAERLGAPNNAAWFKGNIRVWRLFLALVADESLTEDQLATATADFSNWRHQCELAQLRYRLLVRQGQFERALAAAQERERLERNAGMEFIPARSAFLLAKLGRRNEASAAAQESLAQLPRVHPAVRPYYPLAQAFRQLGCHTEAAQYAHEAYRQAWRDGPPHCHYWDLQDARELLDVIGEAPPDLPTVDPTTVRLPLEDEVWALIEKLKVERK